MGRLNRRSRPNAGAGSEQEPLAAMIAAAGTVKLQAGERAGFDLNADVTLRLQNVDNHDDALRKAKLRYRL